MLKLCEHKNRLNCNQIEDHLEEKEEKTILRNKMIKQFYRLIVDILECMRARTELYNVSLSIILCA